MRFGWAVLAVMAQACSETKSAPRGLRVPLPDGWVATAGAPGVLRVGPKGRVVLTLERRAAVLPTVESLKSAVEAEGGAVVRATGAAESSVIHFTRTSAVGFLAVRSLEQGSLLLCASTVEAGEDERQAAEALCGAVRLEAVAR